MYISIVLRFWLYTILCKIRRLYSIIIYTSVFCPVVSSSNDRYRSVLQIATPKISRYNWYRLQYQRMCCNKIATNIVFATYIMTASETLHK